MFAGLSQFCGGIRRTKEGSVVKRVQTLRAHTVQQVFVVIRMAIQIAAEMMSAEEADQARGRDRIRIMDHTRRHTVAYAARHHSVIRQSAKPDHLFASLVLRMRSRHVTLVTL